MRKIGTVFLMLLVISCSYSDDLYGEVSLDYSSMDNALNWFDRQGVGTCMEGVKLLGFQLQGNNVLRVSGIGYSKDRPKIINKILKVSALPENLTFNCTETKTKENLDNEDSLMSFEELKQYLLLKWRDPECAIRVKNYFIETSKIFNGRSKISYGVYASDNLSGGKSFSVKAMFTVHYGGVSCE